MSSTRARAKGREPMPRLKLCTICGKLSPHARCLAHKAPARTKPTDPFYLSAEWKSLARYVKARDEHTCQHCGGRPTPTDPLVAHHHYPRNTHPHLELDEANLIALHNSCHSRVEAARRARR
jgi:5-methylcytosine-specific restriction protein A